MISHQSKIAETLDAVNQRFYEVHGRQFHRTRHFPWTGWKSVLDACTEAPAILDVGCGNGRFGAYITRPEWRRLNVQFYHGLDRDVGLLEKAQLQTVDCETQYTQWNWSAALDDNSRRTLEVTDQYNLVVAFGVIHHIFGAARRLRFLQWCLSRLAPGGVLAVSMWDFGSHERFLRRALCRDHVLHRLNLAPVHFSQNDFFLGFGSTEDTPRYCHWVAKEEYQSHRKTLQKQFPECEPQSEIVKDGDYNRYWLWQHKPQG